MQSFKEIYEIIEARRNPELNPKISAYEALKQYKDDPDIYISFTDVNKIGIKPLSEYNTPNGIYTYPLKEIWKEYRIDIKKSIGKSVPFAGDRKFIQVLRGKNLKGFIKDMYSDYTNVNFDRDIKKIRQLFDKPNIFKSTFTLDEIIEEGMSGAKLKSPIGYFWNITKSIAFYMRSGNQTQNWNNILRQLGYDGFGDKSGRGIIHQAEPIQAVFLHKKTFDHVTMVPNKDYMNYVKGDTWTGGDWENGVWENGTWKDGTWKDGTWEDGTWKDGTWENGVWVNGTWEDGIWYKGNWNYGKWENGKWWDGTWKNGIWKNGIWKGGTWWNGTWKEGTWWGGNWWGGDWENGEIRSKKFKIEIESKVDPNKFYEFEKQANSLDGLKSLVK